MSNDPFAPLARWRRLLVRGSGPEVDDFLNRLDDRLGPNQRRDIDSEQTRRQPDQVRMYVVDIPGGSAVRLWLQRVTPERVRGGAVQTVRVGPGGVEEFPPLVEGFLNDVLLPAAAAAGLTASFPDMGPRSTAPSDVLWALTAVADGFPGRWPLPPEAAGRWREFVVAARLGRAAFDADEFRRWLTDTGWPADRAAALVDQFYADAALLADYDDRRQSA